MSFTYDREGDLLYIDKVPPYVEQETEELSDDVRARLTPTTGELESRLGNGWLKRLVREIRRQASVRGRLATEQGRIL